ncbi:bis(5'-nucleosyl)-tetraphosphatase (symmetrical) YqeK [Candidatus Sumerlaeota bacterium]|nr:bis(5'-nucleosyl)-tetraphosphatase (symmetrical) YqeK [Candidatus Sumerlaeota bacterium]
MIHLNERHIHPVSIRSKLDYIIKYLEEVLDRERLLHSLGVYHASLQLAQLLEVDLEAAAICGLVHDCARGWTPGRIREILEESGHFLPKEDITYPGIWHAQLAAYMLKDVFDIDDTMIDAAVRYHPTGAPRMDRMAKLLFIADYIEPNRRFDGVDAIRKLVFTDWEAAFGIIMKEKIDHVRTRGKPVHPRALQALQAYVQQEE